LWLTRLAVKGSERIVKPPTLLYVTLLAVITTNAFAQSKSLSDEINLFGSEQTEFNQAIKEVPFAWNEHETTTDPGALQADVQWLKDHPSVRFYIEGYASTRGDDIIFNLVLSAKRAETVRQTLIGMGIPENRIVLTTGWGQLYPVCPEKNDACWSRNRRVIFRYVPSSASQR
jgi:outer membrane protein OmpA-like peptidoglycan-associated protein